MNARAAADLVAESVMQLADVLAATLPRAVFDRLEADLAGKGHQTAALVIELARARRQAMAPIRGVEVEDVNLACAPIMENRLPSEPLDTNLA